MARLGAGVRKREDGIFEKRFTVKGKRYSIYAKTTKELIEKEQELRQAIEDGLYSNNRNITLDKYFDEWIAQKRKHIKSSSIGVYRSMYDSCIKPILGNEKVKNIERRECVALQETLSKKDNISPSTVNSAITLLKNILNSAITDEIIERNPAHGIKPIRGNTDVTETTHRALTEDEQKAFMQEAKSNYYYEFFALLLTTGMRTGEAGALCWSDIDYKNGVIHINKTLTYNENGERTVGTPKSKSGKRDIPITDTMKVILQSQKVKSAMQRNTSVRNIENRVFHSINGTYIRSRAINTAIREVLAQLEDKEIHIDDFSAHAFRDTFATRFIEQGGTPQTLKTILGHSSLAMTMDLYAHVLPNTKQDEMSRLKIII